MIRYDGLRRSRLSGEAFTVRQQSAMAVMSNLQFN